MTFLNNSQKSVVSVYEELIEQDRSEATDYINIKDGFKVSSQVVFSNQSRLLLAQQKPLNRGTVDLRAMILLAFLKYLKNKPFENFRIKIATLNSFESVLQSFEQNYQYLRKLKKDKNIFSEIWSNQSAYTSEL